ncbi:MAG TPA: hypothetical protein DCQ96_03355, partial [Verrucomicrobiales bacterium]|nr:hypothetical protein [Verrucomicrobiales bacterium]
GYGYGEGCGCGYGYGYGCRSLLRIQIAARCWTNQTLFLLYFRFARGQYGRFDGISRTLKVLKPDRKHWQLCCHTVSRLLLDEVE